MPSASVSGTGHVVVQVAGDHNQVAVGRAHLVLTTFAGRGGIRSELDLLRPYSRSTPLIGREAELQSLQRFVDDPAPMQARVMVGSAGSGKTRLALEFCHRLQGWNAGFVTRDELRRFFGQQNLTDWGWQRPTLVVVDYAAEHARLLGRWLDELTARRGPSKHRLRLLLLERSANTESGWWVEVFKSGGWAATDKLALLDLPEPAQLHPLAKAEDRVELLNATLKQLQVKSPLDEESQLQQQVMRREWAGEPLFLMMAAMSMGSSLASQALRLSRTDLANALALRERNRLEELALAKGLKPQLVQHLAACITLAQGVSLQSCEDLAQREKEAIGLPTGGDPAELAELLQQALPQGAGVAPVQPDLIGEALVLQQLQSDKGRAAVLRIRADFGRPAVESVVRCAMDFGKGTPAPLQWLDAIAEELKDDAAGLAELGTSLRSESVQLRELNLKVAQRRHQLAYDGLGRDDEEKAAALDALSSSLALMSRPEEALQAAEAAVVLRRALAAQRPELYAPGLAGSLRDLGITLGDVGRLEEALQAAQEAVQLHRELAALQPDVHAPDLAKSLKDLSRVLGALGRREEALQAAQEAVQRYSKLAAHRPDLYRLNLARSLNTLAVMLSLLGRREEALHVAQEAAQLDRQLAEQRPNTFAPNLAQSLGNLSDRLRELGRREEELQALREAVALLQELAAQWPDLFAADLARSVSNLSNLLSDLGQREEALQAARDATQWYRQLASQRPEVFTHQLAASLNNLGIRLAEIGRGEEALRPALESVALRRELVAQQPDVFAPGLARSLYNLSITLNDLDRWEDALEAAQEAAQRYLELSELRPDSFVPDLATSLEKVGNVLGEIGRREEALRIAQKAEALRREVAEHRTDASMPDLGKSLRNLAVMLNELRLTTTRARGDG